MFETQGDNIPDNAAEREITIESTSSFKEAIAAGNLAQAESWLDQAQSLEQYDDRWVDHRERELFKAYYAIEDWVGAKRIVEKTKNPDSQTGRRHRLEDLIKDLDISYDEI